MEINHEIIKEILLVFEQSSKAAIVFSEIEKNFNDLNKDLIAFHLILLHDKNLIVRADKGTDLGIYHDGRKMQMVNGFPIRLTASGYDYLNVIKIPKFWEKLKGKYKNAALNTTIELGKLFLKEYIKSEINS